MKKGTPSDNQLANYKSTVTKPYRITTSNGAPIGNKNAVLTAGKRGPMLMQDVVFMDEMAHFDRERIPERVVHAKGAGAHGYFEVTHDVTKYCKADLFNKIGKLTPVFLRFSTVEGELGSSDTNRDPRGFAVKFYTEEGNWDIVGNNTPIFFIRDPILFPNFVHTQKRNPQTNLKDNNAIFDFWSQRPESTHQMMFVLSDRGIPDGFRYMHGYGSHTFKLVNKEGNPVYCKFHFRCQQGIKNLCVDSACKLSSDDPDYATRDLFNSIENGNYPAWELNIQVMTFEQAEKSPFNPFDLTKVWPQGEYPLIPVGRMVLNRNPKNYFAEVEQSAFCPAHVVPGVEFSPDRMLQGRIFSYTDTQFHRLGPNHIQLPINCPFRSRPHNTQRGGLGVYDSQGAAPNYHPNSFAPLTQCPNAAESKWSVTGDVERYDDGSEDNFSQPKVFWNKILCAEARQRLVTNIFNKIKDVQPCIQERFIQNNLNQVCPEFGARVRKMIDDHNAKIEHKHHL